MTMSATAAAAAACSRYNCGRILLKSACRTGWTPTLETSISRPSSATIFASSVARFGSGASGDESSRKPDGGRRGGGGGSGRTVFLTAPPPDGQTHHALPVAPPLGLLAGDPLHVGVGGGPSAAASHHSSVGGVSAAAAQCRSLSHSADGGGGRGKGDGETTPIDVSWKGEGRTAVFGSPPAQNRSMSTGGDGDGKSLDLATLPPSEKPLPTKRTRRKKNHFLDSAILDAALQQPAGLLVDDEEDAIEEENEDGSTATISVKKSKYFIPQVALHAGEQRARKRVLVLCTGGTLTMAPDPSREGALAPVEGAVTAYMREMRELHAENMPEVVAHEYSPFVDSSDMGPNDWALIANDIKANYLHFDGFVVLMGTDTMAYAATALSFMLENLGKPVIFTGSQIPLCEPYNDARRNLIMALIFASRDSINEVSIFFHDRLIRACRATKVNTHRLLAFDSPNLDPLAKIGITIDENEHLVLPPARGALRVHAKMDTRLLTLRLVPGFDDKVIEQLISAGAEGGNLRALVLQLYGTGNVPSVKEDFVQILADAREKGILVIASTQCFTGSVMMGHYATGQALKSAGVVSGSDMTLEAIACKCAYLFGRGDISNEEVANLMGVSLRGEVTPPEALSPPPLSSAYQRASRKGKKYY